MNDREREQQQKATEVFYKYKEMLEHEYGLKQIAIGCVGEEIGICCFYNEDDKITIKPPKYKPLDDLPEELDGVKIKVYKMRGGFEKR